MSHIDTDNLSYLTKSYENEVINTAKRLRANDIVSNTLEEVHAKLNNLISELNKKYQFTQDKTYGADGIDDFLRKTHQEIDSISIETDKFVSTELKNTTSHPSINAFKESRNFTAYQSLDFMNKSIAINKDTIGLKFNDDGINDEDKVHTFTINLNNDEALKIVEFNITYRQNPNLVTISDGEVYKEPTIQVSRVIKGRFFVIRPDLDEPQDIIVKAIVDNSDNTSNLIDERVIDVKSSKDADTTVSRTGIGPEFDLYFKVSSQKTIDIVIGRIIPYKWMIQRDYVNVANKNISNTAFSIVNSKINGVNIDKVLYSETANVFFVIDDTNKAIYTTKDGTLDRDHYETFNKLDYSENIKIFNVGAMTILTNGNKSIAFNKTLDAVTEFNYAIADVQKVSSGEIILDVDNTKLSVINDANFTTADITEYKIPSIKEDFKAQTKFIEIEPGIILMLSATEDKIYYQTIGLNVNTGKYGEGGAVISTNSEYEVEKARGWDAEKVIFNLLKCTDNSLNLVLSYSKNATTKQTVIINFNKFEYGGSIVEFKNNTELKYFDVVKHKESDNTFDKYITKVKHTSLFDFGITNENKLVIIDNKYIYDAVTFSQAYEDVTEYDSASNSEQTTNKFMGYSLNKSILYMEPDYNESEYFNSTDKFMQNVFDVVETKSGIYICDKYGVYELFANKNLKTKFYSENGTLIFSLDNINLNSYGLFVAKSEDDNYAIIHQNYDFFKESSEKLRYEYTDLFNEDWQLYESEKEVYDYSKKIIEFAGVMYVTVIDRMSSIYNTNKSTNMKYVTDKTFADYNPHKDHIYNFANENNENIQKNVPVIPFTFTVNKYGISNYHGFDTVDNPEHISDINAIKSFILVHKPNDGLKIDDFRKVIENKIREEALGDEVLVERKKVYELDNESDRTKNRITEITPELNNIDYIDSVNFAGLSFDYGKDSFIFNNNVYKYHNSETPEGDETNNSIEGVEVVKIKAIDIGIFIVGKKSNNYSVYYVNRNKFKENILKEKPILFDNSNLLTIGNNTTFAKFDDINNNWVVHYVNASENLVFLTINNQLFMYNLRNVNGLYLEPFASQTGDSGNTGSRETEIIRPDAKTINGEDEGSEPKKTDSSINSIKVINNKVYFWDRNGKSGIYEYAKSEDTKIRTTINASFITNYNVLDIAVNKTNESQFMLAVSFTTSDSTTTTKPDVVFVDRNGNISQFSNGVHTGCSYSILDFGSKYIVGSHNKAIVVDSSNFNNTSYITLNVIDTDITYKVINVNDEIIAIPFSNDKNSVNCGFYKLNLDNNTSEFVKIDKTSTTNVTYTITNINTTPGNTFVIFVKKVEKTDSDNTTNSIDRFSYISPNDIISLKMAFTTVSNNYSPDVSFATTLENNDNIVLKSNDDHVIRNLHMSTNDYIDKFFWNAPNYKLIDRTSQKPTTENGTVTEGEEEPTVTKEYYVIDGDATKWSPYTFKNIESAKFNDKIKIYRFNTNIGSATTYERIDTSKLLYPVPDFPYAVQEGSTIVEKNVVNFEEDKIYYRRSGKWELVNDKSDLNKNPTNTEHYYFSEDIKYVKAGVKPTTGTNSFDWDDEACRENINTNKSSEFKVQHDTYEIYERTLDNTIYRQSFANSDKLSKERFVDGCLPTSDNRLAIPCIIRDNIISNGEEDEESSKLTGNEDPYATSDPFKKEQADELKSDIYFKSVVYNCNEGEDNPVTSYSPVENNDTPYSVFPIYKVFQTSVGKFAIYKQDFRFEDEDAADKENEAISNKLCLGLISDDYKQIYSVLLHNDFTKVDSVYVFEDADNNIFISNTEVSEKNFIHYNKLDRTLDDTGFNYKINFAFVDDNNDFIIVDTKSTSEKFLVYKKDKDKLTFTQLQSLTQDNIVFTPLKDGLVTRNIKDDLHETFFVGNGTYNIYKYREGHGFEPMFIEFSKTDTPFTKVIVDNDDNVLIRLTNNPENSVYNTVKIDPEDNVIWNKEILKWDYLTGKKDKTVPNMFISEGSNFFWNTTITLIEPELEKAEQLIELPKVTALPVIIDNELYFNNCKANDDDLTEDHTTDFVAYDTDGIKVLYNHVYFDRLFETTEGIFGVYKNEIFRNDIETNGNGFIKVGTGVAGSDYINILETKLGIFYVDNQNVKKYNVETNLFDNITQNLSVNTNKINFAIMTIEGFFIGTVVDRISDPVEDGVKDTKLPAALHWYNPATKSFIDVFDLDPTASVDEGVENTNKITKFTKNDHITDIKETSKGLFIVVNKTLDESEDNSETKKNESNISSEFDYSKVEARTLLIYNNGLNVPVLTEISISDKLFLDLEEDVPVPTLDESDQTIKPADAQFIYETDDGVIYLYGHAWYHNITNGTSTDKLFVTRYQLVKIANPTSTTSPNVNPRSFYKWIAPENEEEFGQNILGKSEMYGDSDGSEEIIETKHGLFLVRTHKSLQNGKGANIIKIKEVEDAHDFTDYGEAVTGLIKDDVETPLLNIPSDVSVKLVETGDRLFAFMYKDGILTIREYDPEKDGFTIEYNVHLNDIVSHSKFSADYIRNCDVVDYNGVLFFKLFNNQVYRYGDWKLKMVDVTTNSKKTHDEVLYDLKIVFENPDIYNNLPEDTTNSEIDKFVVKEVGVVNLLKKKIDDDGNEVYDEDPNSDIFRHITQFFMPHNFYNRSNGYIDNIIMDPKDKSTGEPKEYFRIKNLKQLYKHVYTGFKHNNLINSRFIKENQDLITDTFVHKTNRVLGDMENYLKNTDSFRIELRIYPTEVTAANDIVQDTTINFDDFESHNDRNIVSVFAPEL